MIQRKESCFCEEKQQHQEQKLNLKSNWCYCSALDFIAYDANHSEWGRVLHHRCLFYMHLIHMLCVTHTHTSTYISVKRIGNSESSIIFSFNLNFQQNKRICFTTCHTNRIEKRENKCCMSQFSIVFISMKMCNIGNC